LDIRRGAPEERKEIDGLLAACGLAPLPRAFPLSNVLVALEGGRVVGVVALEVVTRRGVAFGLAIASEAGRDGLGTSLLRSLVSRAQELGLRDLYAVPGDEEALFEPLGFHAVDPGNVPPEIHTAATFREAAGDGSVVLRLELATRF
jgi:N-acetylglutamate synthase-like GNAT family acetyltransferase